MIPQKENMLEDLSLQNLTPDLPSPILDELKTGRTSLARQLRQLLRRAGNVQNALAWVRQRKMKAIGDRLDQCHVEGMGQLVARIDPEINERTALRTGNPLWFKDRKLLHKVLQENPQLRVRCGSRKLQVAINGLREAHKSPGVGSGAGKPRARSPVSGVITSPREARRP